MFSALSPKASSTRENVDCWMIGPIFIQQKEDGLVIIEKDVGQDNKIFLRSSPSNGKVRLDSDFVQMTASLGTDAHMFVRSQNRRLHYSGGDQGLHCKECGTQRRL